MHLDKKTSLIAGMMTLFLILWPVSRLHPQSDNVAERFRNNVVHLFDGEQSGFGFVVAEENDKLYVVTAFHVVRPGPDTEADIQVRFYPRQGKVYPGKRQISYPDIDLALLEVPKPFKGYKWERRYFHPRAGRNDEVWFVGRGGKWYVPTLNRTGRIRTRAIAGKIHVEMDSVQPGTSGAPLISEKGIVGMIIEDAGADVVAVDIDTIRRVVTDVWNYPWGMEEFSASDRKTATATTERKKTGTPTTLKSDALYHTVRNGESLYKIARIYGVTVSSLRRLNRIDSETLIYPGQRITIREDAASVTTTRIRPTTTRATTTTTTVPSGPVSLISNSLGMEFVYVRPGSFMMGSPENEPGRDDDEKQHRVRITKAFYMQTTEVTQGQWKAVMGNNPSQFKNCGDDCPVETVSWNDAQEFIRKLNRREGTEKYRLPTEAEWEYACRAGTSTAYSWGRSADCSKANYGNGFSDECKGTNPGKTMRVASFSPNAWGLYDMHGNVWEWCRDWYGDYPSGSVTDPGGPSTGSSRVGRGGSGYNSAGYCRSAYRGRYSPDYRDIDLGLRLALSPGQQ